MVLTGYLAAFQNTLSIFLFNRIVAIADKMNNKELHAKQLS